MIDANAGKTLDELTLRSRSDLCRLFVGLYKIAPPRNFPIKLLLLAVGYRLQEKEHGGLKAKARSELINAKAQPLTNAGTVLIREWHGVHHTVRVHDDHVEYRGQHFRSLSAVASLITGCQRSGTAFFSAKAPS